MNDVSKVIKAEKAHIEQSLRALRPLFPDLPDTEVLATVLRNGKECNPEAVAAYIRKHRKCSTSDLMQHFTVSKFKIAGSTAALSRHKLIKKTGPEMFAWAGRRRRS